MKRLTTYLLLASLAALLGAGARVAQATGLGVVSGENLITNPGAENSAGVAPEDATGVLSPSGWQTTGGFTAAAYASGANSGGWLTSGGGPPDGGNNYFAGGPGNSRATATQIVNVSSDAPMIDIGKVQAHLSAWLGGWSTQDDSMTVSAIFRNASGKATKGITIGPVTEGMRGGETELLSAKDARTQVPPGTRSIAVQMVASRVQGKYNDGYADDVSLTLSNGQALKNLQLYFYKKSYRVVSKYRSSCLAANECVIANGALVTICNREEFNQEPFSLDHQDGFGLARGRVFLKPGQCYSQRFHNSNPGPRQVKLYDALHSQERFVLLIMPSPAG